VATLADRAERLNFRLRGHGGGDRESGSRLPALIAMTDVDRMPDPLAAAAVLPRGSAIILRHYELDALDRRELARRLVDVCRPRNVRVLIGADPFLACAVGAAGIHLPENMIKTGRATWRLWRRPDWLVTAAAHSRVAMTQAQQSGVDAALLSPVFATKSHPGAAPLGILRFTDLCRTSSLPVYALGGISVRTARLLRGSGAAGIAAIGGIIGDSR